MELPEDLQRRWETSLRLTEELLKTKGFSSSRISAWGHTGVWELEVEAGREIRRLEPSFGPLDELHEGFPFVWKVAVIEIDFIWLTMVPIFEFSGGKIVLPAMQYESGLCRSLVDGAVIEIQFLYGQG